MKVNCPNCGKSVVVDGLGRKPRNMPVKIVCDALRDSGTITEAAKKLACSRGYIYHELAKQGTTPKRVMALNKKLPI